LLPDEAIEASVKHHLPLWRVKSTARTVVERFGIDRFSRPANHDIERKLARHFDRPGFFVEAGAVDGFFESNTYYLERFCGWSGILVEPSPTMFARLAVNRRRARSFNCALTSFDYARPTVTITDAHALSGIFADWPEEERAERLAFAEQFGETKAVEVAARTLQSIVDEVGVREIDLLSLDVEGYEEQVLAGLDLAVTCPRHLLIECLDASRRQKIEARLSGYYECVDAFSYRDFLYKARRQPAGRP
jgi:FkbM family methyltransferase